MAKALESIIVITEKKSVSRALVKALYPESFDERDNCSCEHNDIVSIVLDEKKPEFVKNSCVVEPNKETKRQYFCTNDCKECRFSAEHINSQGRAHYLGTRKRIRFQNKLNTGQTKLINEDISYYIFNRGRKLYIVVDTNGNPLSHNINTKGFSSMEELFKKTEDWKEIDGRVGYYPKIDVQKKRSSEVRMRLINNFIAKGRLPNGKPIELEKIVAATDYDIAGSNIILSIINYCNRFNRNRENSKLITPDMLYRVKLTSMNPEDIIAEFENIQEFDYQNAAAGEIRSLFDASFGGTLTSAVNSRLKINNPHNLRISIGRNQILGLETLFYEEKTLGQKKENNYLIFDGDSEKDLIIQAIRNSQFLNLTIDLNKVRVSSADFMRALKNSNIGTHTTRQHISSQLDKSGVAFNSDFEIRSSPFGRAYFEIMRPYVRGNIFDIGLWNALLQKTIMELSTRKDIQDMQDLKNQTNLFMRYFQRNFQKYLHFMEKEWDPIAERISSAFKEYPVKRNMMFEREAAKNVSNGLEVYERDTCLSKEQILSFMDPNNNRPLKTELSILRHLPQRTQDYEEIIRRICGIGRSYDFNIVSGDPSKLVSIRRPLVFSCESLDQVNPKQNLEISEIQETEIKEYDGPIMGPHEPLKTRGISPKWVAGEDGLKLISEYQAPWIYNNDILERLEQGKKDISSFTINGKKYSKVSWYEFGKAHDYESLLITMFDKYRFPFEKTAEMAEELYLGR